MDGKSPISIFTLRRVSALSHGLPSFIDLKVDCIALASMTKTAADSAPPANLKNKNKSKHKCFDEDMIVKLKSVLQCLGHSFFNSYLANRTVRAAAVPARLKALK